MLCYREGYGYISSQWRDPPSSDIKFVRKRAMQINKTLQCGEQICVNDMFLAPCLSLLSVWVNYVSGCLLLSCVCLGKLRFWLPACVLCLFVSCVCLCKLQVSGCLFVSCVCLGKLRFWLPVCVLRVSVCVNYVSGCLFVSCVCLSV